MLDTLNFEGIGLIIRLKPLLEAEIIVFVPSSNAVADCNMDPTVINVSKSRFLQANLGCILGTTIEAAVSLFLSLTNNVGSIFLFITNVHLV